VGISVSLYVHSSPVNRVSPNAADAIAAQPDGKIVVTAPCRYSAIGAPINGFCTVRFNADFTSDTSFAAGSQNTAPSPTTDADSYVNAIAIQPDGKIVVAGQCGDSSGTIFCAARLLADGQLDATFGGASPLRTFLGVNNASPFDRVKRIALAPDGKIYLGGDCTTSTVVVACVVRLNVDGSIDNAFPTTATTPRLLQRMSNPNPSNNSDTIYDMTVQANVEFIFAGDCKKTTNFTFRAPCALRLGAPGATTFAAGTTYNGAAQAAGSEIFRDAAGPGSTFSIVRVYLQPDGKMLTLLKDQWSNSNYRVRCYNQDGSIDKNWYRADFDFNAATDNASGFAGGFALGQQRSGKVIAMGHTQSNNADNPQARVVRLDNRASPGRNCSGDIDGDGKTLPTTDGLLLTRVAAGLTGNAVIAGAIGASAPRNTWPEILDYLITQCGMVVAP